MARRTRSSVILISPFVFIVERLYYFFNANQDRTNWSKSIKADTFLLLEDIIFWKESKNQF